MTTIVIAMIIIMLLTGCTLALVSLGMEGRGRDRHPRLADSAARAALHLNGEADPPRRLVRVLEATLHR